MPNDFKVVVRVRESDKETLTYRWTAKKRFVYVPQLRFKVGEVVAVRLKSGPRDRRNTACISIPWSIGRVERIVPSGARILDYVENRRHKKLVINNGWVRKKENVNATGLRYYISLNFENAFVIAEGRKVRKVVYQNPWKAVDTTVEQSNAY